MRALSFKRERWTDIKKEATYGGGLKHRETESLYVFIWDKKAKCFSGYSEIRYKMPQSEGFVDIWHLKKQTYSLSCSDLVERINITLVFTINNVWDGFQTFHYVYTAPRSWGCISEDKFCLQSFKNLVPSPLRPSVQSPHPLSQTTWETVSLYSLV